MNTPNLITYDDFKHRVPGLTLRTIRRQMALGRWPKAIKLSPGTAWLWSSEAIDLQIQSLLAGLDVAE